MHGRTPAGQRMMRAWSRRRFLATTTLAACSAPQVRKDDEKLPPPMPDQPGVAIVGGGLAGLACAYHLRKQGVIATVYEARARLGGRAHSDPGTLGMERQVELGGEFINTSHREVHALCKELGLALRDLEDEGIDGDSPIYLGGQHYTDDDVRREAEAIAPRLRDDVHAAQSDKSAATRFDKLSIAAYLDQVGVSGWFRRYLETVYLGEYGADPGDQSCLNMLLMMRVEGGAVHWWGDNDERYRVAGGNQQLATEMATKAGVTVRYGWVLQALQDKGDEVVLAMASHGGLKTVRASTVVITAPFSALRHVPMHGVPKWKTELIGRLGYGSNDKLIVAVPRAAWRKGHLTGESLTDGAFCMTWEATPERDVNAALTLFAGGKQGHQLMFTSPPTVAPALAGLMKKAAEPMEQDVLRFLRANQLPTIGAGWPRDRFSAGSYACYRPGQWTELSGKEQTRTGRVLYAGEHTDVQYQGYMNGALRSGRRAAAEVLKLLRVSAKRGG